MIMATSPAMTSRAFPATERGRALGILALVVAAGTSAGPRETVDGRLQIKQGPKLILLETSTPA
jgi:hypothetical protein